MSRGLNRKWAVSNGFVQLQLIRGGERAERPIFRLQMSHSCPVNAGTKPELINNAATFPARQPSPSGAGIMKGVMTLPPVLSC